MSTDVLKEWPSAAHFEQKLANMGMLVTAGGEVDKMLKRYSAARAALAHERLVSMSKAMGFALAAVAEEMTPREAARVARETHEALTQIIGK
jgi:hypothetical protein